MYNNPVDMFAAGDGSKAGFQAITSRIDARINSKVRAGSYSQVVFAVNVFTVTMYAAQQHTNYKVIVTPTNLLSCPIHYVTNKTTTTFDVVYPGALTGTVEFDWVVIK